MDQTDISQPRVLATDAALAFLDEIKADHPDILFHQSGGCCDGSSPMCYPASEYRVGETDVKLGEIGGVPFYISGSQFEVWKHTQLIIDVVDGRGGMFSLDNGRERRFLTRSRLFSGGEACLVPTIRN
ncbi:acetaldehyde dehydrogenase [Rhizobium sp. ACO-34A]|nr:acetaldehyde dehydrogenase [Rhizobium sp. ACO-34A]